MKRTSRTATLTLAALLLSGKAWAGHIHPSVENRLRSLPAGQKLAVIVEMKEQADLAEIIAQNPGKRGKERRREIVQALKSASVQGQGQIRRILGRYNSAAHIERLFPYWIFNGFAVKATETAIRVLAAAPEVKEVRLDMEIPLPAGVPKGTGDEQPAPGWNIALIRAPEVWAINPAYQGTGAVVGSFDTGVDVSHPDLGSRYRGNNHISWFDPYGEHTVPFDANGNGTRTTATAVGGNASGASIGVAPGATWIAAKGWSDSGIATVSAFHRVFEWFLAPGGDPDNAPDVVNNSWTFEEPGCRAEFIADIEAWRAAGIFPAFASGDEGPGAGTVSSPGAYQKSFTVGATDTSDQVARFSSEGPSPCSNALKPNISAPGALILSAVPGGYEYLSGSSMATPHISGAVAVLRSIDPAMTVEEIEFALTAGARDIADPGPDNSSGAGRLDLYVSAQITILGSDVPVVKVVASDATATEAGNTAGAFTVSRTGSTDSDLVVKFTVSGTASTGSDYAALPVSVTIPAGLTEATIRVVAFDDSLVEKDESVILALSPDDAYIVSGTNTAIVTIINNELMPDLTVFALAVHATAGAGLTVTASDTIRNQGPGATNPSTVRFYLSINNTLDASDVPIGSRSIPALAPDASSSGTTTFTIPQDTPAGTWYIIANADADSVISETNETNNICAQAVQIGCDLLISSVTTPATAGAGQSITLSDTTRNQGGGTVAPSVTRYYLSSNNTLDVLDTMIGSRDVPAVNPGTGNSGTATAAIPQGTATGIWFVIAKADADGAVTETSESNNTYSQSIQIGPDLAVSSLSASTIGGAGRSLNLSDTTKNQGGGAADASVTRYYLSSNGILDSSDIPIGERNIAALAGGASSSSTATVVIPEGTATGTWYIFARADANDAVPETFETNNTCSRSIMIGPDLTLPALTVPSTAIAGQGVAISDTVYNQGGGAAAASITRYYLSTNSTWDASDVEIGNRSIPILDPGTNNSGSTTLTIPQQTAAGTWYIIARMDADGAAPEINENNNTGYRSIRISG